MGRSSDSKEKVLQAATDLFADQGYESVSVDQICQKAEVNKGTFYYYFKKKQNLALAVIEHQRNKLMEFIEVEIKVKELPPQERLFKYYSLIMEGQSETRADCGHIRGCPFGTLSMEMGTRDELIRQSIVSVFDEVILFIKNCLLDAQALGELQGLEPEQAARDIFSNWQGALLLSKTYNQVKPIQAALDFTRQYLKEKGAA